MGLRKKRQASNSKANSKAISLERLLDFLGISKDEECLNEATYFACLKILSESIGKLPLKIMEYKENNGVKKAVKHPLYDVLALRPNPYMTATHFWSTVEYNRNHHGNAYVWILGHGAKTTLWILPSEDVTIWIDNAGIWDTDNKMWYIYRHPESGKTYKISHESIMHFKTSASFDGVSGLSVREQLKSTINGNSKAQGMLNKLYDNGFTAKAVVQYTGDINDALAKKFLEGLETYAAGKIDTVKNFIPIPLGSTIQPISTKLVDNQFLELKRYSSLQIAAAFGIKPNQINDYEKASYAAAEQQQLAFYVDTLLYVVKQYEEEISTKILCNKDVAYGYFAKFNVAVILRADYKTQLEAMATAVQNSIYTPNEARAFLDKESKPGGDNLLCNGTMLPLTMAGTQYCSHPQAT